MEKEINEVILNEINEIMIRNDLRQNLIYFNEKLNTFILKETRLNTDIIIDNYSRKDIDILLEHTTNIIERYGIFKEFVKYRNSVEIKDIKDSVIVIDEFDVFEENVLDTWNRERSVSIFLSKARLNNDIVIFTCTSSIEKKFKSISKTVFDPELCIHLKGNKTQLKSYKSLMNRYNERNINCKLPFSSYRKIIDSLDNSFYSNYFNINDYIYDYSVKKMVLNDTNIINTKTFNNLITEKVEPRKSKKEINNSFANMVGLNNIKEELNKLYDYLEFSKKLKTKDNMYLNLFFLGNPGTGKTTVARMYAEKLYNLGFIKENKLVEIVPNDLIAKYVGQTRDTTRKILEKAKDGILFIDEAYLLYTSNYEEGNNPYMNEAIVELIKYLEDPKNVVIFAGYPKEMKRIYEANPGIKSRIYGEIMFNDYSTEELYEILNSNLTKKGLSIASNSKKKIINHIKNLQNEANFGNARTIIQFSQKLIMNHASRKIENDNLVIDALDLPQEKSIGKAKMGFDSYD